MAMQSAVTQLAVWTCVAPTAWAAAMMIASVPPKPTIAATKAEAGIDRRIEALVRNAHACLRAEGGWQPSAGDG